MQALQQMPSGGPNDLLIPAPSPSSLTRRWSRARVELGLDGESDTAVVERALNAYLLGRVLDATQSRAGLSEDEANRLAYDARSSPST